MVKTACAAFVGRGWRIVADKALQLFDLLGIQRRSGLIVPDRRVVLRGLERQLATFVTDGGGLIVYLPVGGDLDGVTLVAAARGRDAFPGSQHGATGERE